MSRKRGIVSVQPMIAAAILAAAILLLMIPTATIAQNDSLHALRIVHPTDPETGRKRSGDGQTGLAGTQLKDPLRALVIDEAGNPVSGVTVHFDLVTPNSLSLGEMVTGTDGVATLPYTAGKKTQTHTIIAHIETSREDDSHLAYHIPIRKANWVLFMIFGLGGGLALFLFGMEMMSSSLQRTAGGKIRAILGALTRNRFIGVAVGAFVTMLIQSSSATTVMLVSFVEAGLIGYARTLGVILGADIGTTITAQLIAFKLTDYALAMIAVGFGFTVLSKKAKLRNIGESVLGFGILFYGMHVMSSAMYPLRTYQPFLILLQELENPILGILIGTVFTALIQSSSAFTGIIIVLAQQGFLTLTAGIPLIFGANIGTCITAYLATLGSGREAKRVALAHTLIKVVGVLIFVWWIPAFARLIAAVSPGGNGDLSDQVTMARLIPREIANAHTIFNVATAIIFIPFTALLGKALMKILPDKVVEPEYKHKPRHLDPDLLAAPALALNLAKVEILGVGNKAREMAQLCIEPFLEHNVEVLDTLRDLEDEIDELERQITRYLLSISQQDLNEDQASEVYLLMHVNSQFEQFADIVDKDLRPLAQKMIASNVFFSESGTKEVRAYHFKMVKQVSRALLAFRDESLEKAKKMTVKQAKYVALEGVYRQAHFERVRGAILESIASSEIHLELMDILRRMNSYTANIARAILAQHGNDAPQGKSGGSHSTSEDS